MKTLYQKNILSSICQKYLLITAARDLKPLINIQRGPISSVLQIKIVVSGFLSDSLNLSYFRYSSSEWFAKLLGG